MALSVLITVNSIQHDVTSELLKDSLKLSYSLFKDLEPSTNRAEFKLSGSSTLLPLILATTDDVIVEILEGSTYLFKGYLTDNFSWSITNRGQQPVIISAEDPGIKLLKRNWVSTNALYSLFINYKVCDPADTNSSIIHKIAALAGVTVSSLIPTISSLITLNIQDKDNPTYWEILKSIVFEYGYVFYFENDGELNLYPIAKTTITPATTFSTTTNIIAETEDKGVEVQKGLVQYKQINLTWDEWETKTDIYVFRDSTGGDNTYDCNIPLAPGEYYPAGADASTFVFADYKAETGQDIVNVTSATLDYVVDSGITVEFENLGIRGKLRIHNTSAVTADIRKLKIKATSAILKKNTNITKAGVNAPPVFKYSAKHIHDSVTANTFVNTIKCHYSYSNYKYYFKSRLNVDVGVVATLQDSLWSTINEPVLIINKEVKENGIVSYTATGVDAFDLFEATSRDITIPGDGNSAIVYNPQILTPTITIGTTSVDLGETTTTITGVSVDGTLLGNADTATKLTTPRKIGISGKVAGAGVDFDGSAAITINTTSAAITSAEITDATSANTASMVVKRDTSGNFAGNVITATNLTATTEINNKYQKLYAHYIPGSSYEILTHQNTTPGDVFTIFELKSPNTAQTETTLSQHNVISGWDDWVRDVSFHNYSGSTKAVDVISHFTGATAGNWQWVSRYTTGTDYDMIERYLMTLEGDTGNLIIGEDDSLVYTARAKVDIRNKAWTTLPSLLVSVDSSNASQPSALQVQNGNNYAYFGNLATLKLTNATDVGTVLKLENAGIGNYLTADSVFTLTKAGNIIQSGTNGIYNGSFASGSLGTGWKIDYNSTISGKSYLEVDNLLVRDTIRTHIFQKDVIKATNGQLYVSDSGIIAKSYDGTEPYVVHFDVDKSATFNVNDIIIVKDVNINNGQIATTTKFQIDIVGTVANGMQPYTVSVIDGTLWNLQTGMTAVRISGGTVLIDANTTHSPFIDVLDNGTVKARLGNLAGVAGCTGYGLYSDNVFLNGKIVATSGTIGGFTIGTHLNSGSKSTYDDGLAGVHIGADGIGLGNTFTVSDEGYLNASNASITGNITAISGQIGSFNISTYLNTDSKTTYDDGVAGLHVGSDGLGIGSAFTVSSAGLLTATNANITGKVNATSGSFSGTIDADDGFFGGSIESGPLILNKNPPATTNLTISGGVITFLQNLTSSTGLTSGTFACTGTYNSVNIGSVTFSLSSTSTNYNYTYRWHWGPFLGNYTYVTENYRRTAVNYTGSISFYRADNEQQLYSSSDTYSPASNWGLISSSSFESSSFNSGWDTSPVPANVGASGGTVNFGSSGSISFTAGAYTYKLVNLPAGYSSSYATGTVYYDSNGFLKIKI